MSITKKIVAVLCSFLLLFTCSYAGFICRNNEKNTVIAETIQNEQYEVWSAPSTVKIERNDTGYEGKREPELKFLAVKGEYESYQLMITAKTDISSYFLVAADLSDGKGNSISKENIDIYAEHYTQVETATNANLRPGSYPDALVPIDLAKNAGELSIAAGNVQGIWVTVEIPKETVAGTYTGTFQLQINGDTHNISVTCEVANYTLSKKANMSTAFNLWDNTLMGSELDSTLEMKETYYEFFLDYRINLTTLPIDSLNVDKFVETVEKYFDDERVTNYGMPFNSTGEMGNGLNLDFWEEAMLALAAKSTPERNLLSKATFYFMDEVHGTIGFQVAYEYLDKYNKMLQTVVETIKEDTSGIYDQFKQIEDWEQMILRSKNIVTMDMDHIETRLMQEVTVWVPGWGSLISDANRRFASESAEQYDAELWWYGCSGPQNPYPTYHIDDNLLSSRVINWMAQAYGYTGLLYWSTATAKDSYDKPGFGIGQDSDTVNYGSLPAGDGYLVYPGAKYGHYGPLPSLRLMSIRDGIEEYEILLDLENKYEALNEEYGTNFNTREVVANIYSRLYTGMVTTTDVDLFDEIREDLFDAIEEMEAPHGFVLENISVLDNTATITMYVRDGYTLQVNGDVLQETEGKYIYNLHLNERQTIDIVITNKENTEEVYTMTRFISNPVKVLNNFDSETVLDGVTVSANSEKKLNTDPQYATSNSSLDLTITSVITGDIFEDMSFEPSATISSSVFAESVDFTTVNTLNFDVYSKTEEDFELTVYLTSGTTSYRFNAVTVSQGMYQISLDVANIQWSKLNSVDGIKLVFANQGTAETPVVYSLCIDNLFVDFK